MAIGYILKVGDKTTCGGTILTGSPIIKIEGKLAATEGSIVNCGKHSGQFKIIGGVDFINTPTGKAAGTLDSVSSCPCKAKFIASSIAHNYTNNSIAQAKQNIKNDSSLLNSDIRNASNEKTTDANTIDSNNQILITKVIGKSKVVVSDNFSYELEYKVDGVNKFSYDLDKLNGKVNWDIIHVNTGRKVSYRNKSSSIKIKFDNGLCNADLYHVYAYLVKPIDEVSVKTWFYKSYPRLIEKAIDVGNETCSDIFRYFCDFYLNRYKKFNEYENWDVDDDLDDMLEVIYSFVLIKANELTIDNFKRRQKIVDHFDVDGGKKLRNANEFDNEWDKTKHFMAGMKITDKSIEGFGCELGFWTEKWDLFIGVLGTLTQTRESHQVGFDWKDFAWTAAGAKFYNLLVDSPNENEAINIMKYFQSGKLRMGTIFNADPIDARHTYGNLRFSPFVNTEIDVVDAELKKMGDIIVEHYN